MSPDPSSAKQRPRRKYDASRRQADARDRRRRIVDAATELFLTQGYGPTSIDQIAAKAEVSPQTVYATFESKAGVLAEAVVLARNLDDDDRNVHLSSRAAAIVAEPDLRKRCRETARLLRDIYARSAPMIRLVERAAATDAAILALQDQLRAERRVAVVAMTEGLPAKAFRRGIDRERAVDALAVLSSAHVYSELVEDFGWSPEQFEAWLGEALYRTTFSP